MHEHLDIAHWKAVFSLSRLRVEADGFLPWVDLISGPYDIAVLEQLREATYAELPAAERVATDVFLWSRGEPEQRAVTKIGGLPYWVKGRPWPHTSSGTAMTFVAQLCFVDSRDLLPVLPGDLLLIFAEGEDWFAGADYESESALEWISLSDLALVSHEDIPETGWQLLPCYGTMYRTWDYPKVDASAYPDVVSSIPPVCKATKLGGLCPGMASYEDYQYGDPEGYFATLSSLSPAISEPFPFLNVPEPISQEEWEHSHPLIMGEMGLMNLFLKSDGTVDWWMYNHW